MVQLFYTTFISVDLAHCEIVHAFKKIATVPRDDSLHMLGYINAS